MSIPIIFEDESLLVLDKPSGITVNRSDTSRHEQTVQDFTEQYLGLQNILPDIKQKVEANYSNGYKNAFYDRGGIVHRLDKETSGILLVAKNPEAFINLQKQFHDRLVQKNYLALVHGVVLPADGEVTIPVDRLPWNRKRFGVIPGGRASETTYKTLQVYVNPANREKLSMVELLPKTGRTHQIRVHMKYVNHPIFADFLYAGRKTSREDRRVLDRVFLHAAEISFLHPETGKRIFFTSPLPQELAQFVDTLVQNNSAEGV